MSMRGITGMSHLRILLRHVQSFQARYCDRKVAKKRRSVGVGKIVEPDAHTIVLLALIGVLLLLNFMLRFPGVAAIIAEGNRF